MKSIFYPENERGQVNIGWLNARHSFSFGNWYNPSRMGFGALRVLNDDRVRALSGFSKHPHQNMEIITIPLVGSLRHQDDMGNTSVIKSGEVQVMSAGSGVYHSEFNPETQQETALLQIWIMPDEDGHEPRYDQRHFDQKPNEWNALVGPMNAHYGLEIHQNAYSSRFSAEVAQSVEYKWKDSNNGVYFFLIQGEASIEDQILKTRDALGVWDVESVNVQLTENSELLALEVPINGWPMP